MINRRAIFAIPVLLLSNCLFAGIKDISIEKLPNDPIIKNAYEFVSSAEPLVETWVQEWKYKEPKDQIAASFQEMLKDLRSVADKTPNQNNAELQLFIGLSAHYAYNVDVENSFDLAMSSLQSAERLLSEDYRPLWFKGEHLCQTAKPAEGMSVLLRVEEKYPHKDLPEGFWADYLSCSHLTLMPVHGLRALSRAAETGHINDRLQKYHKGLIETRLKSTELDKDYSFKKVWINTKEGDTPAFFNPSIGLYLKIDGNWRLQLGDLKHGNSVTSIELPEIKGIKKPMAPTLTIIAKAVRRGESLDEFKKTIIRDYKTTPASAEFCSRMQCEAYDISAPFYPGEEGAHLFVIFMERPKPEFPGIIFEYPHALPSGDGSDEVKYYRAEARPMRLESSIRYAIILDSCVSIYPKAKDLFEMFLKNLIIE